MQNQILEYKDVTLGYGQDAILKDINISIDSGVLLPFVGPNGAGKTTIFKSMLGFIQPLKGSITRNFGQCCPGYVPQQKNLDTLYPISVRQIIEMGLYAKTNFLGLLNKSEKDKLDEIYELNRQGAVSNITTLNSQLYELVQKDLITPENALIASYNKNELELLLKGVYYGTRSEN